MRGARRAGEEIDPAAAKLVDKRPADVNGGDLQNSGASENGERQRVSQQLRHRRKHGEQIDEPERAERLDEGEREMLDEPAALPHDTRPDLTAD